MRKKKSPAKTVFILLLLAAMIGAVYYFFIIDNGHNSPLLNSAQSTTEFIENVLYEHRTEVNHIVNDEPTGTMFVNNELLLTVKKETSKSDVELFVSESGGKIVGYDQYLAKYQIQFETAFSLSELENISDEYMSSGLFENVRVNLAFSFQMNHIPNDKEWKSDWGNSPGGKNWGVEAINSPDMWGLNGVLTAQPVNVGVLDNQFYTGHSDLNYTDTYCNDFNANLTKPNHGTHVAGTIAALFNNNNGIAGVAPNVNLFGASYNGVHDELGGSSTTTVSALEFALSYLICIKECKVINISMGYDEATVEASNGNEDVAEGLKQISTHLEAALLRYMQYDYVDFVIVKSAMNDGERGGKAEYDFLANINNHIIKDRISLWVPLPSQIIMKSRLQIIATLALAWI